MRTDDYCQLLTDLEKHIAAGATSIGTLGLTDVTLRLVNFLERTGRLDTLRAIYVPDVPSSPIPPLPVPLCPMTRLADTAHDVLLIADDDQKEEILKCALPFIRGLPKILLGGYGHYRFRDQVFEEEYSKLTVPSLANGYPNTLTHIYQCLANAARLDLSGVVAEFGMFMGGTTMFLSRLVERLQQKWPVIGFDTFAGFPPRRSVLDMYSHPDCVFTDVSFVSRYLAGRNIEIITGDIVDTVHRLDDEELVLSFFDTDNYTPGKGSARCSPGSHRRWRCNCVRSLYGNRPISIHSRRTYGCECALG